MRKRFLDQMIVCISLAIFAVAWAYPDQVRYRIACLGVSAAIAVVFLFLAWTEKETGQRAGTGSATEGSKRAAITEIVLLSEEDTELMAWELYGKTSAVIGRDARDRREEQVDIDLSRSPFASMVDVEHAVLNFSAGGWYVEDLGSANGLRLKKAGGGKAYRLSADTPCRLEKGDCLYVGMDRLLLR